MKITHVFSFLLQPAKGLADQPKIGGAVVPQEGKLFAMLSEMFDRAHNECKIEISFEPVSGNQENPCRSDILSLFGRPSLETSRVLAARLQAVSTHRSGMGLLFLIVGKEKRTRRLHISRFPADIGILAEQVGTALRVEFLEKVFMRNAFAYKAAVYEGVPGPGDMWDGRAIDKQINQEFTSISSYWIREFLLSDFRTTPVQGTRRLAIAMLRAIKNESQQDVRRELVAAAMLGPGMNGESITITNFAERFRLSQNATSAIMGQLEHPNLRFERFRFSSAEFLRHLPYRSVDLDNGATLTASTSTFDDCFKTRPVRDGTGAVEFSTKGRVVSQRFRKTK